MKNTHAKSTRWRIVGLFSAVAVAAVLGVALMPSLGAVLYSAEGWSSPTDISATAYGSYNPEGVIDPEGYSHVVWFGDGETNSDWSIWYVNNRNGGNWSAKRKITTGYDLRGPRMVIDSAGTLHVIYEDRGVNQIMYIKSTDRGATWTVKENVSNSSANAYECALAVDADGTAYAAWIDSRWAGSSYYSITYSRRPAGGSWTGPVRVQSTIGFCKAPRIAVTGSGASLKVHITFQGKRVSTDPNDTTELYYIRGDGTSWEAVRNLSQSSSWASYTPDIVASGASNLYIVWDENPYPQSYHDIFMRRSTDNGSNWDASIHIVYDEYLSRNPAIGYGVDRAQIVYDSTVAGSGDVFYSNYNPASGSVSSPLNLAQSGGESKEGDITANECRLVATWMDKGTRWNVMYSTSPATAPAPCYPVTPSPTTPTVPTTPPYTNTPIPTVPTATPDPRPYGWVAIKSYDPQNNEYYTRLLDVALQLWADSNVDATITDMRVCNLGDPSPGLNCPWISYAASIANWPLLSTGYNCENKWVQARFRDNLGTQSITVTDYIDYDNYLTATMSLNEGRAYTNRTMVMVNSVDRDIMQQDCSGLQSMRLMEQGSITYTIWISYYPQLYYFLAPEGGLTRTVSVQYSDYAGNVGAFNDSIRLDVNPPYSGTPPTLNATTTELVVPVSGLQAFDRESGIANVWLANRSYGPWLGFAYCKSPPCTVSNWNLGYGGPPFQYPLLHHVYVKYEDASGYGPFQGNFSQVYSGTTSISEISNVYVPLLGRGSSGAVSGPSSEEASLILMADPQQAAPGQDVLLYLAVRRDRSDPLDGTLRMVVPKGLRIVRAWSAYGQLLQAGDGLVVSRERAWDRQVPWILVQARVEPGAGLTFSVQGDMTWDTGTVTAAPVQIENR